MAQMAGRNERRNFDRRKDYDEGHGVRWDLTVGDLVHLQSRPFKKTYKTFCKETPTTWRFEMSLPEVRDDGTCSLAVLLERTDSIAVELDACIYIDIFDPNHNLIFKKQTFQLPGSRMFLQGDALQETVEMIPLPNMRDAIHRNPEVRINLVISFCHSDSESDEFEFSDQ